MLSMLPAALSEGASRNCARVLLGTTLLVGAGCDAESTSATDSAASWPTVRTLAAGQVQELLNRGDDVTIVDLRSPRDYLAGHLPTAVSIPYVRLNANYQPLGAAATIVLYCQTERTSSLAARELERLGLDSIYVLAGGFAGWRYPVESGHRTQVL